MTTSITNKLGKTVIIAKEGKIADHVDILFLAINIRIMILITESSSLLFPHL